MTDALWKTRWRAACQAFDGRLPRERWLLAGCGFAVALWLGDSLALNPAMKRWKAAQQQAQEATLRLAEMQQAQAQAVIEAEQQRKQREVDLAQVRAELAQLEGRPGALEAGRMLALLEEVVARQGGAIRLRALTAKPDAPAAPRGAASGAGAAVGPGAVASAGGTRLYRHGIELVLTGRYEALHRYESDLARSESRLRVRQLSLVVREHPEVEMTLLVETLSPQAAWLTL